MKMKKCIKKILKISVPLLMMILTAASCESPPDFSGTYYTNIGPDAKFITDIDQRDSDVDFSITGKNIAISGTGTVRNRTMILEATMDGGTVIMTLIFSVTGEAFSGNWEMSGFTLNSGTITGTKSKWAVYDVAAHGLPQFISSDCIDLDKISRISRFRSGEGHDYSDDFESCRSMKHYFFPREGTDMSTISLYSPVNGTITGTTEEWEGTTIWKGTAVGIRPDGFEEFWIVIFHVNLIKPLIVGDRVTTGQLLGSSQKTSGTASDVAVCVHTGAGNKLVSYFEVMDDPVLDTYKARGLDSLFDMIITESERDADPLVCDGETFLTHGSLENWFYLN